MKSASSIETSILQFSYQQRMIRKIILALITGKLACNQKTQKFWEKKQVIQKNPVVFMAKQTVVKFSLIYLFPSVLPSVFFYIFNIITVFLHYLFTSHIRSFT